MSPAGDDPTNLDDPADPPPPRRVTVGDVLLYLAVLAVVFVFGAIAVGLWWPF